MDPGLIDAGPPPPSGRLLDRDIWRLAGPALLTLAAEPLYLLTDTAIVGRLGTDALAGLAVASALLLFVSGACIFLTFGTAATVARLRGAGDGDEAAALSIQGLWLGLACGLACTVGLAILAGPLVRLFGAGEAVVDDALLYLRISLIGLPALLVGMAGTGALRGHLDTRTPLVVTIAANVVNLLLELVLVFALGWGLAGSAAGTVVAQWGAAAAYVIVVGRLATGHHAGRRPDRRRIRSLGVVARDLFIRTVALRSALTFSTFLAARRGATALAAYQIAFQWWTFLAYLLDALEAAAQSLVAQALGAADRALARVTARRIMAWSVGGGAVLGAATLALREPVAHLFTNDRAVIPAVATSLLWVGAMQPLNGAAFSLDGVLVGAGDQRFLARAMLASLAVLIAGGSLLLVTDTPLWGLWLTITIFMASRVLILGRRFRGRAWERTGAG